METIWKYTVGIVVMFVVGAGAVLAYYAFLAACFLGLLSWAVSLWTLTFTPMKNKPQPKRHRRRGMYLLGGHGGYRSNHQRWDSADALGRGYQDRRPHYDETEDILTPDFTLVS